MASPVGLTTEVLSGCSDSPPLAAQRYTVVEHIATLVHKVTALPAAVSHWGSSAGAQPR
jgi:hypothetical protein